MPIKWTENETIDALVAHLGERDWEVRSVAKGRQRGHDIDATKGGQRLIVEAKGARGGTEDTVRHAFDSAQIKDHAGTAIVRLLEERSRARHRRQEPQPIYAIAYPDDSDIRDTLRVLTAELPRLGIWTLWVRSKDFEALKPEAQPDL